MRGAVLCLVVSSLARSSTSIAAEALLVERSVVSPPPRASLAGLERRASAAEYDEAASDTSFALERLVYRSDGLRVVGYLFGPARSTTPRPVIIYLRGGYLAVEPIAAFLPLFRTLARAGFSVLAPQLRESEGGEGKDEVGGADVHDVTNLLPLLPELGGLDASRLFLYGESRGGMMTYRALRDGFAARAAAVFGAFTNLEDLIRAHPDVYVPLTAKVWPDFEQRRDEILAERSAVLWADELRTPLLIMHGGADTGVDPRHSLRLAEKLQEFGAAYELEVYAGGDHNLSGHRAARDAHALEWFRRYLDASPAP